MSETPEEFKARIQDKYDEVDWVATAQEMGFVTAEEQGRGHLVSEGHEKIAAVLYGQLVGALKRDADLSTIAHFQALALHGLGLVP